MHPQRCHRPMATQLALTWGSIQPHFVWASSDIESHGFLAHVTHHGTRIRVCPCIRKISIFHLASSSSLFLLVVLISHIAIAVIAAYQLSLRPYNSNIPSYCCILAPTRLTGTNAQQYLSTPNSEPGRFLPLESHIPSQSSSAPPSCLASALAANNHLNRSSILIL